MYSVCSSHISYTVKDMIPSSTSNQRREFTGGTLHRHDLLKQPLDQFQRWLQEAVSAAVLEPYAVTLATIQPDGLPAARTVLLKRVDNSGFVFTTAESPKTRDFRAHPHVVLVFYWPALERQVRISGCIAEMTREESATLYATRPHDQRIALLTFPQSQPIPNRKVLDERFEQLRQAHAHEEVPLPAHWGAWRVTPSVVEFWQGGVNRLHDRFRYVLSNSEAWTLERLAP